MSQQTLDNKEDGFINSFNLNEDKIKEDLEEMRIIEGFPLGDVEDILEISEPPFYTAYPNPYIKYFIEYFGTQYDKETDDYNVEPFVGDVTEGKNDSIYKAHSYHTKVPHKAIIKFIKHYTNKGDIIFDGFSGSGMTGVAAQILDRNIILNDISPAGYFISYNYNNLRRHDLIKLFNSWKKDLEKYYITHDETGKEVFINYTVWTDVFECPFCNNEINFWEVSLNEDKTKTLKSFKCPGCHAKLTKNKLNRVFIEYYDKIFNKNLLIAKQVPVRIYYKKGRNSFFKDLDKYDLEIIDELNTKSIPYWMPLNEMPNGSESSRAKKTHSFVYVPQYYTNRSLFILSYLWDKINKIKDFEDKMFMKWIFTSINPKLTSKFARFRPNKGKSDAMSGVLYMPSFQAEYNILSSFESKLKSLSNLETYNSNLIQTTQSSTDLSNIPNNSIDYIFVDPPFGSNLMYSELNFLWESWLKVFTNSKKEAIVNNVQNKDSEDYKNLLIQCFSEFYRILKPNRWITIEFHNSKAEIWNIIRESIIKSGFIIAQIAILDKKQGTFKQINAPGSVKNDLIINAYKPDVLFSETFDDNYGVNLEVEFLEMHLNKLPISQNIERTEKMLYSKYLAKYILNDFEVRLDSTDFSELLNKNFIERDGFWFTSIQLIKYEQEIENNLFEEFDIEQTILGISDEKTALMWLSQFLKVPKSYDEVYNEYVKKLMVTPDKIPELRQLLDENFSTENGKYKIPSSIEKTKFEEIRVKKLDKDFNFILEEAKSKSKITEIRKEALFYGLTNLYKEKDVDTINLLGKRVDKKIIESDEDISAIIDWAKYK